MTKKSISNRWFINSFSVVAILLLIIDVSVFFVLKNYYYNAVHQYLRTEAGIIHGILEYMSDYGAEPALDLRRAVEEFDKKSRVELMVISKNGQVDITSSGFSPHGNYDMPDYTTAKLSQQESGSSIGYLPNSEHYMAVTIMLANGSGYDAVRLITSLDKVDMQIYSTALLIGFLSIVVLLMVLFLGLYFIKSILLPLRQIGNTARHLARGDFSKRIEPSKHDDEISELCRIFNYMAAELENSENIKNDFISSVSHELRTPLTAIKGWSETITITQKQLESNATNIHCSELSETLKKGMKVITTETDRLSEMVEELLDFSRIQSGHFSLQMARFDVLAELTDALLVYEERARREEIKIEYSEPEAIIMVFGDKNRIRQVFINIIDNAIKYSNPGGVIRVDVRIKSPSIEIEISDKGCGISEADLPKIKNKFYKANNTVRGSGIGLAVADEIITRHNGTIDLYSKTNEGTTVRVVLPMENKV